MTRPRSFRLRLRGFARDMGGTTAAEFALVLPLFLLFTLGTINMALAMSSLVRLHYSTERAARCLAVDVQGNCSSGAIDAYAKSLDPIGGLSDLTFTYDAAATCGKKVNGSGTFEVLTGVGSISVPVTASACYPVI